MKKQIFSLFFVIMNTTSVIAMDTTYDSYQVTPVVPAGQRLLESKDKTKKELCKKHQHNVQLCVESKTHHLPTFKTMSKEFYQTTLQVYRETQEFKDYQQEVQQIAKNFPKHSQYQQIQDSTKALQRDTPSLYKQLKELEGKRLFLGQVVSIMEDPVTGGSITIYHDDLSSMHYKKIKNPNCKDATFNYDSHNHAENKAFHDNLYNLKRMECIMEYKWSQKWWWHRLWNREAYKQEMTKLQNEIDLFQKDVNRDAFSRSHMLQYAKTANEAEKLYKNLKLIREEQYHKLQTRE